MGGVRDHDILDVLAFLDVAAVLTDLDGRIQDTTEAFRKLIAIDESELKNQLIQTVFSGRLTPGETDRTLYAEMTDCLDDPSAGLHSDRTLCLVSGAGDLKWVHPYIRTVHEADGRPQRRLLVLHDITSLYHARRAAERKDRNYRMLVEQANTVVMHVDAGFSIQFINAFGANLFQFSRDELEGRSLFDTIIPPRDPAGADLHAQLHEMIAAPELHGDFDQQNRCADGSWIWIHWAVRAVRNEQGGVEGLLCIGTEITRRKHAEIRADWYMRRSRHLADELLRTEERERARIAQYLHDQVIQMLSLANIRMGGILAGQRTAADSDGGTRQLTEVRRLIEDAIGECRSMMDELVPTLLHEVGLGAALTHLVEQQCGLEGRSIRVDDRSGKRPFSRRIRELFFQSTRELLMNALKHAGPCEIIIRITADEKTVEAAVSDNGAGFDPDNPECSAEIDAGGFGLFNIRERLASLGGVLTIDSAPGKGTRAAISVPISNP